MKIDTLTEASMRIQAGLPAPFSSRSGPVQPAVITFTIAESTRPTSGEALRLDKEPDDSLAGCPQGSDCAGESERSRLFDCEAGCGFRGCGACMEIHESEPHASDSDVMLAMVRDIGGSW